jgi:SAM-dependent methyltransferase
MSQYSHCQYVADDHAERFYYNLFFRKGQKILDIGCSTGNFIAQDPENIKGIDIDKDAVLIARKRGFDVQWHDARRPLPFRSGSFGHVHCRHVLEHLADPLPFMREILRVLAPGGRILLLTDRMTSGFWDDYTHQRPYTLVSLRHLAKDAGFRKFSVYPFPAQGVFGAGKLFEWGLLSPKMASVIYRAYARVSFAQGLVLEAVKG